MSSALKLAARPRQSTSLELPWYVQAVVSSVYAANWGRLLMSWIHRSFDLYAWQHTLIERDYPHQLLCKDGLVCIRKYLLRHTTNSPEIPLEPPVWPVAWHIINQYPTLSFYLLQNIICKSRWREMSPAASRSHWNTTARHDLRRPVKSNMVARSSKVLQRSKAYLFQFDSHLNPS